VDGLSQVIPSNGSDPSQCHHYGGQAGLLNPGDVYGGLLLRLQHSWRAQMIGCHSAVRGCSTTPLIPEEESYHAAPESPAADSN